jgi:hypothetical protein
MDEAQLCTALEAIQPGYLDLLARRPQNYGTDGSFRDLLNAFRLHLEYQGTSADWPALALFINEHADGANGPLDLAISAILIEGLARPDHPLDPLLRGAAKRYWDHWR